MVFALSATTGEALKLSDIVTLEKGKPPAQQSYFGTDAELYLTPEYLRGKGSVESVKPSANAVHVSDGDTILLWDGSNAGEFFRGRRGILASTMSRISHDDTFDKEYFFYAVKSWESYLKGQTSGSGIPHVDQKVLGKLEVFQFSKPEQAKIAEILSTVDRAIEQTEALIAKQQRIKTGLMQDLLTRGIDEHGNLRSEQTHKFKNSPLGRIPVEWDVVETKRVYSLITKGTTPKWRSVESPRYSIPYLRVQNLTFSGLINFSEEISFIDCATHEGELARSKVLPGDFLQNIVGPPLGKIGIVPSDYPEWNINQAIALFRLNETVSGEFLCHWLQIPAAQTWFDINSKKTSGQKNLTLEHCQQLPIVLPSLEEQNRICLLLECSVVSQRAAVSELQKLHPLKTALMQDLLTGKKRVTALLKDTEVAT